MDPVGATGERGQRVGEREAAVVVPVPVDPDALMTGIRDNLLGDLDQVLDPVRSRMAGRIRQAEPRCATRREVAGTGGDVRSPSPPESG